MKHLDFRYQIDLEFDRPVTEHHFLLRCLPPSFPGQQVRAELLVGPGAEWSLQQDGFGNLLQPGYAPAPHRLFSYGVLGEAEIDLSLRAPEKANPVYRFPSACTVPDAALQAFLAALLLPSGERVRAEKLLSAVHDAMDYVPGTTCIHTTAAEAFHQRQGVCQDFAHIFLTLARSAGLCARYANGIHTGGQTSHAWCEVYLGGRWVGMDPTSGLFTDENYLRFNVGRDYLDCPLEKGLFRGLAGQQQHISVSCIASNE